MGPVPARRLTARGLIARARIGTAAWLALLLCAAALFPRPGRAQAPDEPPVLTAFRKRLDARAAAPSATLAEPRMVDGALLPAGTVVRWTDAVQTRIYDARLPGPAPVLGTVLAGRMYFDDFWIVRLAADAAVDGWPCSSATSVSILTSGKVLTCELAADARRPGVIVPAGSRVFPNWADGTWSFNVPDGAHLRIGPPGVAVQGASDVSFNADGTIRMVAARSGQVLGLHGVRFQDRLTWVYAEARAGADIGAGRTPGVIDGAAGIGVRGRLARMAIRGKTKFPPGTEVILTFAGNALRPAP